MVNLNVGFRAAFGYGRLQPPSPCDPSARPISRPLDSALRPSSLPGRYNVRCDAAGNLADVGRRLFINTAQGICRDGLAATTMALIPFSGSAPAWAALPWITTLTEFWLGACRTSVPIGPPESSTRPTFDRSAETSSCFAPFSPPSSATLSTISSGRWRAPESLRRWSTSRMTTMPALQSPPSIVVPSLVMMPSLTIGLIPRPAPPYPCEPTGGSARPGRQGSR